MHRDVWKLIRTVRQYMLRYGFERFIRSRLRKGPFYTTVQSLIATPPSYDVYIAGSDQIWNPAITGPISSYFFDFVREGKRIAWAASIGDVVNESFLRDNQKLLSEFDEIFVREKLLLLALEGCIRKPIGLVFDPVFLTSRAEWRRFANLPEQKHGKGQYILVYWLGDQVKYEVLIEKYRSNGLAVINLHPLGRELPSTDRTLCAGDPTAFIRLIDGATLVVTDSFHATALSLIIGTPVTCSEISNSNGRLGTMLGQLGIDDTDGILAPSDAILSEISKQTERARRILLETIG